MEEKAIRTTATFVVDKKGNPLMPTFNRKKVRKLLKSGKAVIFEHFPFTIQLKYDPASYKDSTSCRQPIEYTTDTGYQHAGISVKSQKHEYLHTRAEMLSGEKKNNDTKRTNRRTRRNRLRYRAPRFDNRRKEKGWIAPSLEHRIDNQINLFEKIKKVCPITEITAEVGKFDTQALEATEKGLPVPQGVEYQHGPRFGFDNTREAVLFRDGHKCLICNASGLGDNGVPLVMHHVFYWRGDHTDRMGGLVTLCTNCHTPANHQKGGILWGFEPELSSDSMAGAAFMSVARWRFVERLRDSGIPVHIAYGAAAKRERLSRNIEKTHANDAYCIGQYRPRHRSPEVAVCKKRRNDRKLEKFYDAQYKDTRDGKKKSGKELSCGRTKRKERRNGEKNQRIYRGKKLQNGHRNIRKSRYDIRPNDKVIYDGKIYTVHGTQNNGKNISLNSTRIVDLNKIRPKVDKKGAVLPIKVGQKLPLVGKKEPHEVLFIDDNTKTATLAWAFAVKPNKVTPVTRNYGGWKVC